MWVSKRNDLEAWSSAWAAEPNQRHSHDFFQLTRTRSGVGRIEVAGHRYDSPPGACVLIPPGEIHELHPADRSVWVFDTLFFSVADLTTFTSGDRAQPVVDCPTISFANASVLTDFDALHRSVTRGDEGLVQADRLQTLLTRIGKMAGVPMAESETIVLRGHLDRVRQFMESHLTRDVSLAELAAVAGVGECHLTRAFRRAFGQPPHAFHRQLRVSRARRLLKDERPIVDVAAETGFADQAHFTRHFKRLVGVTPGAYLRGVKNVQDA